MSGTLGFVTESVGHPPCHKQTQAVCTTLPSCHVGEGGSRRWLAYTLHGCISTQEVEGFNTVEVAFHDTSRSRKRIPILNDFYRFHLASMSEKVLLSCHSEPLNGLGWHEPCLQVITGRWPSASRLETVHALRQERACASQPSGDCKLHLSLACGNHIVSAAGRR